MNVKSRTIHMQSQHSELVVRNKLKYILKNGGIEPAVHLQSSTGVVQ